MPQDLILRISQGSLDLLRGAYRGLAEPRVLYLLQYSRHGCAAQCRFCAQALGGDRLGRIPWPAVPLTRLLDYGPARVFERACLQTILKPGYWEEALAILQALGEAGLRLSLAVTPVPGERLAEAKEAGVDHLGVGLDAFSRRVFARARKPYTWEAYLRFIGEAAAVYGPRNVYVHLIAGLGETPEEVLSLLDTLHRLGVRAALFPLVSRTRPWNPLVGKSYYRRVQLAVWLLNRGLRPRDYLGPGLQPEPGLKELPGLEEAFLTQGCPGCNRPFYTERPGDIYNYPSRILLEEDLGRVLAEAGLGR